MKKSSAIGVSFLIGLVWQVFELPSKTGAVLTSVAVLQVHNEHRQKADLPALVWDQTLTQKAASDVAELGKGDCERDTVEDSYGKDNFNDHWREYKKVNGKNTYVGDVSGRLDDILAKEAIDSWYGETQYYLYPGSVNFLACTLTDYVHTYNIAKELTQMMFYNATKVGCAIQQCPTNAKFGFVCVYDNQPNPVTDYLFKSANFLKLCKEPSENGKWKTCSKDLQEECSAGKPGQNKTDKASGATQVLAPASFSALLLVAAPAIAPHYIH